MAGGVNVKMGVSGVAQFKQSINQAKQNLKTLDAQLQLTEKQYKATGDAETYMQQKSEQLKAKLEEQKNVAAAAEQALATMTEKGVDKSSKAFQDMIRTLAQAKGDILDTESALNGIEAASDNASDGVSEMNAQLANIGSGVNWQNVTEGIGNITAGIGSAITKAWKLGEALVNATLGAGSWADELGETAEKYEDTLKAFGGGDSATEALQRMRKTARLIDTDVDTILSAQDKLSKNREGKGKEFMGALAYLGIDPDGMSDLDLFWKAGQAIAKLGDEEDKVSYANQLFGKSWRELMPLFKAGRTEYEKTYNSWNVVEDEQLENLQKMDDQYQKMTDAWETFKTEMLSAFSGPLTEGMTAITGLFEELNKYLDTPEGKAMLQQIGDTISSLITDLTKIDSAEVVGGLKSVIDGITEAFKWIDTNKDLVVAAMGTIVAGWAALKITGGALEVLKIINAVKGIGITSSAAATAGATAGSSWAGAFASAAMKAAPFLAFLYTLLNPSSGSDELGNNTMIDKEGNLTKEAQAAGWTKDESGAVVPKLWTEADDKAQDLPKPTTVDLSKPGKLLQASQDWQFDDNMTIEEAMALAAAADKMNQAAEDLTGGNDAQRQSNSEMTEAANGIKGLPAETAEAVRQALNGAQVRIDGGLLSAYVGQVFAQWVANQGSP